MKQMATIITNDAFSNLDPRSPQDVPAASKHPTFPSVLGFIGGEMPHWVKKFVKAMVNLS